VITAALETSIPVSGSFPVGIPVGISLVRVSPVGVLFPFGIPVGRGGSLVSRSHSRQLHVVGDLTLQSYPSSVAEHLEESFNESLHRLNLPEFHDVPYPRCIRIRVVFINHALEYLVHVHF
jgi:hypothetical protein